MGFISNLVKSAVDGVRGVVDSINSKTGASGDAAGAATLFGKLNALPTSFPTPGSTIKNIQRGTFSFPPAALVNITISAVNPAKSVCNLPTSFGVNSSTTLVGMSLTSTTNIQFQGRNGLGSNLDYVSWELIEYN